MTTRYVGIVNRFFLNNLEAILCHTVFVDPDS